MKIAIINSITRTPLEPKKVPRVDSNKDAMIIKFARELQRQGLDLDIYISDAYKPAIYEELGVSVYYLPTCIKSIFWPSRIPFMPTLFIRLINNYDIVVSGDVSGWGLVFAVLAKIFSFKRRIKIISWQEMSKHFRMLRKYPSLIYHRVVLRFFLDRFVTAYIPRSKPARIFLERQGISQNKIFRPISHGVDRQVFFYDPSIKKERYIFSPSRLVPEKGIDILLKAFAMASRESEGVKLIIQGDGPLLKEYQDLAGDLNIANSTVFCPERVDHATMRIKYQKALVTVIASKSDLIIFSDMESLACGTPVIISCGVDSHLNFTDEKGGIIFHSQDYKQLARAMIKIINDEDYRKNMEEQALEKAELLFNDYLCERFREIIYGIYNEN